ncbi:acyltransferase family protein [Rarobacter incanus]|uniref:Peptidoglycan/LPS O-acetylase OafA/YrhL n=1 Tax=Rarobacter incanus TaxID=153494 RepID=A0A542SNW1_9MICO|nr:acyltransferase family protein [Rarobacter incanus]TQK75947.1 peptidoglycan/LPS O-acetylase OafA/YrhL [Rarobacter incanus]
MEQGSKRDEAHPFAGRIYGLDAMRALAVVLVLVYHIFPQWLPGGFIGVDVFFVVSGFLITGLLLREWQANGRIDLGRFWLRRARRLLPALLTAVLAGTAIAGLIGGDILVGIGRQIVGALTFTSNWLYIAAGSSYASGFSPEMFTHLWSLAVEEQFYLVWPLILTVVLGVMRSRRRRGLRDATDARPLRYVALASLSIAALSAVAMAIAGSVKDDPSAVYYGTHTHLAGLMLGAALAAAVSSRSGWRMILRARRTARAHVTARAAAIAAAGIITGTAAYLQWSSAATYIYGITLASLSAAVIIAALLCLPNFAQRAERGALAWVGQRSYGLYLYHWPLVVIAYYGLGGWPEWVRQVLIVTLTFVITALSYRFVEQPVRTLGFKLTAVGAVKALRANAPAHTRRVVASIGAATILAVGGTAHAVATAPTQTELDRQLAAGQAFVEALSEQDAAGARSADSSTKKTGDAAKGETSAPQQSAVAPKPIGKNTTIIGDSVTLAAAQALEKELPKIGILAKVGRSMNAAPGIIKDLRDSGELRPYVVIALATNSTIDAEIIADVVSAVGKGRAIVFLTGHAQRSWIKPTNRALRAAPKKYKNVFVADWDAVANEHPGAFGPDGIHPYPNKTGIYADLVVDALKAVPETVF